MSATEPPEPGAQAYWHSLVTYLYTLETWDFDRDLFGVVLLSLVARSGALVVDVRRKKEVKDVVAYLSAMLLRLFGISATVLDVAQVFQKPYEKPQALVLSGLGQADHMTKLKMMSLLREMEEQASLVIWVRARDIPLVAPWLIDMFTLSYTFDGFVELPSDLTSPPIHVPLPPEYISNLRSAASNIHIHPPLALHLSNLQTATSHHPRLKSTLTARSQLAFPAVVRAHRLLEGITSFATAENAHAVFMMLVRHRVSLRAEHEEIFWLLHGASSQPARTEKRDEREDRVKVDGLLEVIRDGV